MTLRNHRHEKVRIELSARMDDVFALIAKYRRLDPCDRHRRQVVACHGNTELLARVPAHARRPDSNLHGDNLPGTQKLLSAVCQIRFRRG